MPWRYERANMPPTVTKNRLPMINFEAALYVLCRTEDPTVGVGVVHQALAAPQTPQGGSCFTVCVTDGCEVAGERSLLTQTYFHKPIRSDLLSSPSWRLVTSRVLRSLCCKYSWREVKTVRLRLRLSVRLHLRVKRCLARFALKSRFAAA